MPEHVQSAAPPPESTDVLIVGCGRHHRCDDQFGLHVATRLSEAQLPGVCVIATEAPGTDLLTNLDGVGLLVIVDAAQRGVVGQSRRLVLADGRSKIGPDNWLDAGLRSQYSSHRIGVADALRLGEELGILPPHVWIYAAAGADFGYGENLSSPVAAVVAEIATEISRDVAEWRAQRRLCHA